MFDSLYSQAKRLHFPAGIETRYREDYFVNTISSTRIALLLGIVLYAAFGILDLYAAPLSWQSAWFIRYGIVIPLLVLTLFISTSRSCVKWFSQPPASAPSWQGWAWRT